MSALVKTLVAVAIVWFAWTRFDASNSAPHTIDSAEELQALAKNVRADEVVIYTTSVCPYSAQAKGWMTQYGFQFTECNAQTNQECARQLTTLTDTGVPYLIVRGHHMKNGFDSDEFISALQ